MDGGKTLETNMSFKGKVVEGLTNPFSVGHERGPGVVVLGHQCLVFGGWNGTQNKHFIYTFDRVKRSWTRTHPNRGLFRISLISMAFIANDMLYAFAWDGVWGRYVFVGIDLVLMEEWVRVAQRDAFAPPGYGASGEFIQARNEAVVFGGMAERSSVSVYSVERSTWYSPKVSGTPPEPRYFHATCSSGLKLFVLGGMTGQQSAFLRVLSMSEREFSWSTPLSKGNTPTSRFSCAAACVSGRVFIYGGGYKLDMYSIRKNRWYTGSEELTGGKEEKLHFESELNRGDANHKMVVVDNKLLIFGGNKLPVSSVFVITPSSG